MTQDAGRKGSDGVGISAVQLATTEVIGNREYHIDVSAILTILRVHTVVPSPFPWKQE